MTIVDDMVGIGTVNPDVPLEVASYTNQYHPSILGVLKTRQSRSLQWVQ